MTFNNVLGAIMNNAELLADRLPQGSTEREDAEAVVAAAEKGAALTRQLLTFSGRQTGTLTWLDLSAELQGMQDFLRRLLTSSVEFVLDIDDDCGDALIDKIQLQQILLNLVTNARDAMPDGGKITIELKAHTKTGLVRLTVRDTGIGIEEAMRNRIFEPFFTTKQAGKGTGLGLAVTHGIVDGAGGWIDVESGRGAATAFHVILPVRRR